MLFYPLASNIDSGKYSTYETVLECEDAVMAAAHHTLFVYGESKNKI